MNKKRGIVLVIILVILLGLSSIVWGARCELGGSKNITHGTYPDDDGDFFKEVPNNKVVTGLVWGSVDEEEFIALQYRTLNPDCSLGKIKFTKSINGCQFSSALTTDFIYLGTNTDYNFNFGPKMCWTIEGTGYALSFGARPSPTCADLHKPVKDGEVVVGFGGGLGEDNNPHGIVFEVWNISDWFRDDAFRLTGMVDDNGAVLPEPWCGHYKSDEEKGLEMFIGSTKDPLSIGDVAKVPKGYVVTGIGTSVKDSADDLVGIKLKVKKLLIDVDEDGVWDNPDEENYDRCVDWDNETGEAVLTSSKDVFKEGDFAGCTCEQIKEKSEDFSVTCQSDLEGNLSERICGDEGIKDLGQVGRSSSGNNYICLKDDPDLVGSEGKDIPGWDGDRCQGDWCWVLASTDANFHIFTIKKPGEEAYDVVSNNEDWFECKEGKDKYLEPPFYTGEGGSYDLRKIANRFYCYQEGKHWSWAECYGKNDAPKNINVKGRHAGEGAYALFLLGGEETEEGEKVLSSTKEAIEVNTKNGAYQDFYGDDAYFDFSGYDYLEFLVKFVDEQGEDVSGENLVLPANVFLRIYGPRKEESREHVLYFNQSVLGYVVNNPFFEKGSWMHVKVPIKDFKGITQIKLDPVPGTNNIKVKDFYLTKKGGENLLCSGIDDAYEDSWLDNLDQGSRASKITGEKLCKAHYGEKAWLGRDDEVEKDSASCCGNEEKEYYSGNSKADAEGKKYGCWNSQVIGSKDTIMNVEFEVGYEEKEREITYPPVIFMYDITAHYSNKTKEYGNKTKEYFPEHSPITFEKPYVKNVQNFKISNIYLNIFVNWKLSSLELTHVGWDPSTQVVNYYFLNNFTGENLGDKVDADNLKYGLDNILVVAKTSRVEVGQERRLSKTENFTYTCNQAECLYPLPKFPPYKITNPHPELYELWFVKGSQAEDEVLITNDPDQKFNVPGNLKVKKVAQQVVFVNEEDKETGEKEQGFFGCQAVDYLKDNLKENLPYCAVKGNKFCAHSVAQKGYTTINSWSNESLTKWGYQEIGAGEEVPEDFELEEGEIGAGKRNHSTGVVPGRNFLTNAEFTEFSKDNRDDLLGWEIFDEQGILVKERDYVRENMLEDVLTLKSGYRLKSERVAVPKDKDILFTQEGDCRPVINFYDKEGNLVETTPTPIGGGTNYYSGEASYLILEGEGPCGIKQPMLQLVDDLGEANYSYKTEYPERRGAACCPSNWCWNGYACVKEMSNFSYMKEQVGEGRFYRCIAGEWKHLPIKWDWNFDKFGFCSQPGQCFVVSSLVEGADPKAKAEDFYQGKFPVCINDSEYIFDHYCQEGNWTSRTKFLATKLLDFASSDEYVLYCTNYKDALLDYGDKENYLGGRVPGTVNETAGLGEAITGETKGEQIKACFPKLLGGEGERLVPEKENTCINNVCVLRFKEGGKFKSAFATTLNKDINSSDSFLIALNIPQDKLNELCRGGGDFAECGLSGLNMEGNLWYADKIKGVIYGKEGIRVSPSVWDKIKDWFSGLFGGKELEEEKGFLEEATNFKELYLLNKDGKKARAIEEIFPKNKTLIAEYENFETPICDYVKNRKAPTGLVPLEEAGGRKIISCNTTSEGKQKIIILKDLDFWWPQLTGKLRTGK